MPPRKRRGKRKNDYFTKVHEDAIVRYAITEDKAERSDLYIRLIGPAFDELVDKIVYTYKFSNLPNIDYLKDDCKLWLVTILDKYDVNKKSKAFSYFSVITKNWFIHKVKKQQKQNKREVDLDNISKDHEERYLSTTMPYLEDREKEEFWRHLYQEMASWDPDMMKENERKVYEAIKILFDNSESIEIFNKKAIYLYLREITGLNTKQVVNNLNKLRKKYKTFKRNWDKGDT